MRPLMVIANRRLRGPFDQPTFIHAARTLQETALSSDSIKEKTVALWQMERLGFAHSRFEGVGNILSDPAIPREVLPIAHVGLGAAAMEVSQFARDKALTFLDERAHPAYRMFALEMLGCLWAVHEQAPFRLMFQLVSRSKIRSFEVPAWDAFTEQFTREEQRVIAHGVGRTLYFRSFSLGAALDEAISRSSLDSGAAAQGIAFAYSLVNYNDMAKTLGLGGEIENGEARQGFSNGLVMRLRSGNGTSHGSWIH